MVISKSDGTTASERYLAKLCAKTFLSMWSYPNVFRDQGRKDGKGDGKELCDLLVICGDDVLIFSDKSCAVPDTGDIHLDWARWFRRSILKSADQVYAAEQKIRRFPDRLYLDRPCTQALPLSVQNLERVRFHRIVVALGSKERSRKLHGGSGSLVVLPTLIGEGHTHRHLAHYLPFAIGQIDPARGYVHVFDDVTLDLVLRELDTITDLVRYLSAKEELITSGKLAFAAGEEDLLAAYLFGIKNDQHAFMPPKRGTQLVLNSGSWISYESHPQRAAKKLADRLSYLWDLLIEDFAGHTFAGTLLGDSKPTVEKVEPVLRIMALEDRFQRRILSQALTEKRERTPANAFGVRWMSPREDTGTAYVFLFAPFSGQDLDAYRLVRQRYLSDYCFVLGWRHRECKRIVGIGSETVGSAGTSHDLILHEPEPWTPELEDEARSLQEYYNFLREGRTVRKAVDASEYPAVDMGDGEWHRMTPRNAPCPCESGKKFKNCCGR